MARTTIPCGLSSSTKARTLASPLASVSSWSKACQRRREPDLRRRHLYHGGIRSLHSQSGGYGFFAPGTCTAPSAKPATINDLVAGGTLAYQVTVPGRLKVLMFGGTNFMERELAGLRPDVTQAMASSYTGMSSTTGIAIV
jgi:hypothetical protein